MAREHDRDGPPVATAPAAGEPSSDTARPRPRHEGPIYIPDGSILDDWIARRQALDQDRRDEMWEGVYRVNAQAHFDHDGFVHSLSYAIQHFARRHKLGRVGNTNIRMPGSEDKNFRVPDLVFIREGGITRFAERSRVWIEHGPDLVVEVRSPSGDPREKLAFYAARGIPEVVIFDSWETPKPEVLRLSGSSYLAAAPDQEGGLALECLGARLFYAPAAGGLAERLSLKDDRTGELVEIVG